ncbi:MULTISPECIES: thioredoxin domain-containing protein [Methanohalophilus]
MTLVMLFLPTCPHCRAIEPHFREYSKQYGDSVLRAHMSMWSHL